MRELNAEYGVFFASVQGGEQAEWGTNTWAKLVNIVEQPLSSKMSLFLDVAGKKSTNNIKVKKSTNSIKVK